MAACAIAAMVAAATVATTATLPLLRWIWLLPLLQAQGQIHPESSPKVQIQCRAHHEVCIPALTMMQL